MSNQYMPPMRKSDEAEPNELDMARAQGDAYAKTLKHMATQVADVGGETRAGDYIVAYAIEAAEGMYHPVDGKLVWREPTTETVHVEVSVRDGADNRFIPGLTVHATLIDAEGKVLGTHHQPFLWHPWLYHYGRNWDVPQSGTYTLRVHIDAPDFARHDQENGRRFAEDVDVEFADIEIEVKPEG